MLNDRVQIGIAAAKEERAGKLKFDFGFYALRAKGLRVQVDSRTVRQERPSMPPVARWGQIRKKRRNCGCGNGFDLIVPNSLWK